MLQIPEIPIKGFRPSPTVKWEHYNMNEGFFRFQQDKSKVDQKPE